MLTKDKYFNLEADKQYMSVSQFKSFLQCEAKTMAYLNGEWKEEDKDAYLIGSYVHAWNEGNLEKFRQEHPEMFKKDGSLYAKYQVADKMIKTLANDKLISKVREGQKEVVMTSELFGLPWKIMIDIYNPDKRVIADIKTTRKIISNGGQSFIEYYDYFLQLAIYCEVERLYNNRPEGDYFHPHIIAVSKETIPDKAAIYLGTEFIKDKLLEVEISIDRIKQLKLGEVEPIRCEECDYCKSTKQLERVIHYTEL
jgi:hypothetical protein